MPRSVGLLIRRLRGRSPTESQAESRNQHLSRYDHTGEPSRGMSRRTIISMSSQGTQTRGQQTSETWTTRRLLKWMAEHFESKQIDSPRVVAEMLLAHVLGCERMKLYMEADRPASASELTTLRELVARAPKHEPVQYLVGHAWFFGRQCEVNRSTLIPRPCTETLVEHIIQWRRLNPGHAAPLIADIGTGTGCISVSLAAQIADGRVVATDVVPD